MEVRYPSIMTFTGFVNLLNSDERLLAYLCMPNESVMGHLRYNCCLPILEESVVGHLKYYLHKPFVYLSLLIDIVLVCWNLEAFVVFF